MRPAVKIQSNVKVLEAFLKMQEKQTHIAIVEDENERFIGIITIEAVLEEVVGDIYDRVDQSQLSKMLSQRTKFNLKS
ncbi:MAG: CBS domain-containing protein [Bdellovibrionales bacterium]|nr:CBS domain-containing protein [Bdellovibrionales bacterium]